MTGPEHYSEAEQILAAAKDADAGADRDDIVLLLKFAELHFAAARTAALALQAALPLIGDDQQVTDWCKAIGTDASTADSSRVAMARALIDDFDEEGLMTPATVERLREVLGPRTQPSAAAPNGPSTEAVEEFVELMYQADILDGSEWAADRAANIARALLKAGVTLPKTQDGGA